MNNVPHKKTDCPFLMVMQEIRTVGNQEPGKFICLCNLYCNCKVTKQSLQIQSWKRSSK